MTARPRRLGATMAVVVLALGPGPAWSASSEWEEAQRTTRDRVAAAKAALPGDSTGKQLADMAEKASADGGVLPELYRRQDEYVARATGEWREGADRKTLQEASGLLQRNSERLEAAVTSAREAARAASTRIRQSGVLEKMARLEAAAKDAGTRLAGRWERERAMREREREQREREAGERAREQRR